MQQEILHALVEPFKANNNFFSLEYEKIQVKLYYIHWEANSTGIVEQNHLNNLINIYPNPFSTQTTLQTDNLFKNATVSVENYLGQVVKQINNISGQTVTLFRDNLPCGLYFVRLTQDRKVISIGKLVITD